MIRMSNLVNGIHTFLQKFRKDLAHSARGAPDGRDPKGQRWKPGQLLGNGVLGKFSGMRTLRGVEMLSEVSHGDSVGTFGGRRMPDNTLGGMLTVTGDECVNWLLWKLGHKWHRSRMLEPCQGAMVGAVRPHVVVYDGKTTMQRSDAQPAPYHRKSTSREVTVNGEKVKEKVDYWAVDTVRAVLASSAAPVCLALKTVREGDEVGAVQELDQEMMGRYRWFATGPVLILADAKHGNKEFLKQQGDPYRELPKQRQSAAPPDLKAREPSDEGSGSRAESEAEPRHKHYYLLKVKGNAGAIYKEGMRAAMVKAEREPPEAMTDFENAGHGRHIKREIWRVDTNHGLGIEEGQEWRLDDLAVAVLSAKDWPTVRQVVLVKQTTRHTGTGKKAQKGEAVEWRLAVTNIKKKDVTAVSLLRFLRMEWTIEVYHNLLDQVMREDDQDWATLGTAPTAMAGMVSLAANAVGMLKSRHLRSQGSREHLSYPQLITLVMMVVTGGSIGRILDADRTGKDQAADTHETDEVQLDPAFAKQWSDAELALLLAAIRLLAGFVGRRLSPHHRSSLTLSIEADGTVSMVLQTE
jgi:hypothetical protein